MEYTFNSEPPDSFRLWSGISVIASALERKCRLDYGRLTFYPNMYIVLVGPSGTRKGTAMQPAQELIEELGVNLAAEAITREALIRELRECGTVAKNHDTGELVPHASLTIFSPELVVFFGYNNPQLLTDLTDWYDCRRRWTYRTKNVGTDEIINLWVNLIGATTPELVRTAMPLTAVGGGLTSRICFIYEHHKGKTVPCPFLSDEEVKLKQFLIHDLQIIHSMVGRFMPTKAWVDTYVEWYLEQDANPKYGEESRLSGYQERRPNHVIKLSIILSASRTSNMIVDKCDMDRAIKILEDAEIKMAQTFSGVGRLDHSDLLQSVMREVAMRKDISLAELTRKFAQDIDPVTMDNILESLSRSEFAKIVTEGDPPRRVIKYLGGSTKEYE